MRPLSREQAEEAVLALAAAGGSKTQAAKSLGMSRQTFSDRLTIAARYGLMGFKPVPPGFEVSAISSGPSGDFVKMRPERHERGDGVPEGHVVAGVSTLLDGDGRQVLQWVKTKQGTEQEIAWREALEEFKLDLPKVKATAAPEHVNGDLCVQYTVTDHHIGMLADSEETGDSDYDLQIAEKLLIDWFNAAVAMSPSAGTAIFAQIGDLMHYDSMRSETPEHRNMLDSDTRPQKMIRAAIRVIRRVIDMLLAKHEKVHVIMAKANHDPYSSAWMRESLSVLYENEPRLTVETSAKEYYAYPFGKNVMFYHHGHKKGPKVVDTVFVGMFRDLYGAAARAYAHMGDKHHDLVVETNLMRVEQHRTLAPKDAYASAGGWLSGRDAKVIVYHKEYGEVSRLTLSPEMVSR